MYNGVSAFSKNPFIPKGQGDAHVEQDDDQHDDRKRQVGYVPVSEQFLHGLQPPDAVVEGNLIPHQPGYFPNIFWRKVILPEFLFYAADRFPALKILAGHAGQQVASSGAGCCPGRRCYGGQAGFLQMIIFSQYVAQVGFHLLDLAEAQGPPLDRPWYLNVNEPADHPAGYHRHHAPESDGNDAAELEGRVEQDHHRTEAAQEDMELQPVFQAPEAGKEAVPFPGDVGSDADEDQQRAHNAQPMPEKAAGFEIIVGRVIEPLLDGRGIIGGAVVGQKQSRQNDNRGKRTNINAVNEGRHNLNTVFKQAHLRPAAARAKP